MTDHYRVRTYAKVAERLRAELGPTSFWLALAERAKASEAGAQAFRAALVRQGRLAATRLSQGRDADERALIRVLQIHAEEQAAQIAALRAEIEAKGKDPVA